MNQDLSENAPAANGPRFFEALRLAELKQVIAALQSHVPSGARILEIGAGIGWQARELNRAGYEVEAIDLPASSAISNHARKRVWPITDYDGAHIPFPDGHFDVVFSSNVLEHVVELDALDREMHRTLKPGGISIHLVPNSLWRLLSLFSYYPGQAVDAGRVLSRIARPRQGGQGDREATPSYSTATSKSTIAKIGQRLFPPTHGAVGTPFSEISRFSKRHWDEYFSGHGWDIMEYGNNGLLASGDYLLGHMLPMPLRRQLGHAVGGIAHFYILKQSKPRDRQG